MGRGAIFFCLDVPRSLKDVAKFNPGEFLFLNKIPNYFYVNFSSTLDSESFVGYFFVPTADKSFCEEVMVSYLNLTAL